MRLSYLDHGGHRVNTAQVLHDALCEVGHAQTDGPVGVAFQLDHLIGTGVKETTCLSAHRMQPLQSRATVFPPPDPLAHFSLLLIANCN